MPIGSDRLVLLGSTPGMLSHTRCLMHKRPPGYRATRISFTVQVPIGTPIVVFPLFICLSGILPFSERTSQYQSTSLRASSKPAVVSGLTMFSPPHVRQLLKNALIALGLFVVGSMLAQAALHLWW